MTITTAKKGLAARLPRLAPLAAALVVALPAQAQWRVTPSLSITETLTDNVNRGSTRREGALVSELTPGVDVYGQNEYVQLNANASASLFGYTGGGRSSGNRRNRAQYGADGRLKVIDEFMYVDASASGGTRNISAFGLLDDESRYSTENSTDVSTWSVSPFITRQFGNFAVATLRYTLNSVDADYSRYGSSTARGGSVNLTSGRSWQDLGWNLQYSQQDIDNKQFPDTASENALLSLNYRLSRTLRLTASGGYDSFDYATLPGNRTAGASWSVGFAWNPSSRTVLEVAGGRHFLGNTGSLLASHRSRHTVTKLSYSDQVTSTRQQFSGVQGVDTAALIDSLFAVTIPDPVARRQAVLEYLLATGLPLTTAESVNYLTNRYFRQKQALASFAYNMRGHSTVLSAYATERIALSTGQADSDLLGSALFALNDNVRQFGTTLAHSYRLNAMTSATAALRATRNRSLTTDIERDQQTLSLGMTRRFSRKLFGNVELRHTRGDRGISSAGYHANSIRATITAQL